MNNPKLAIVIPYFKIDFFERTLKSLSQQKDQRFHIYIGNDASENDPSCLINKYISEIKFTYIFFDKNLGGKSLSAQWHRCIKLVKDEDWLVLLGDDDVLDSNFVSAFYANLKKINEKKIDVVRYSSIVINSNDAKISKLYTHPRIEDADAFLARKLKGETRSSLSEYIFRKNKLLIIRFKSLPLAWYSDLLAVLECSDFGLIYTINESVVGFRLSGKNITSKTNDYTLKNIATFDFYFYLLNNNSEKLSWEVRNLLFDRLEKTFLDNKRLLFRWVKFTWFYFEKGYFLRYLFFLKKCGVYIKENFSFKK